MSTPWVIVSQDAKWDPPADLAAWLESGPKPILVTFGSMKFDNAEVLTRKARASAEPVERLFAGHGPHAEHG